MAGRDGAACGGDGRPGGGKGFGRGEGRGGDGVARAEWHTIESRAKETTTTTEERRMVRRRPKSIVREEMMLPMSCASEQTRESQTAWVRGKPA